MSTPTPTPRALAVGGLDPSAGAGVLLDAFVMARLGHQPAVAVTTVTAQNSAQFAGAWPVEPEALIAQLDTVLAEGPLSCVKVGALGSERLALALAGWLAHARLPVAVFDPVLASSSGGSLVDGATRAVNAVARVSTVITPNAEEAMQLAGVTDARGAARSLAQFYDVAVAVTGLAGGSDTEAVDVLWDAGRLTELPHPLIADAGDVRGTGCMLSSALACHIANGLTVDDALSAAHATVRELLASAGPLGHGRWQLDLARIVQADS